MSENNRFAGTRLKSSPRRPNSSRGAVVTSSPARRIARTVGRFRVAGRLRGTSSAWKCVECMPGCLDWLRKTDGWHLAGLWGTKVDVSNRTARDCCWVRRRSGLPRRLAPISTRVKGIDAGCEITAARSARVNLVVRPSNGLARAMPAGARTPGPCPCATTNVRTADPPTFHCSPVPLRRPGDLRAGRGWRLGRLHSGRPRRCRSRRHARRNRRAIHEALVAFAEDLHERSQSLPVPRHTAEVISA